MCVTDEDVVQTKQKTKRYVNHKYQIECTRKNFKMALDKLTKLPPPNPEDGVENMLSITGKHENRYCPELFQIYQISLDEDSTITINSKKEDDTKIISFIEIKKSSIKGEFVYYFSHLEQSTHKRLSCFKIDDIQNFELDSYNAHYRIELINGVNGVALCG